MQKMVTFACELYIIIALHAMLVHIVNNSLCKYVKENNYKNIQKNIYIHEKIRFGKYFNVNSKVLIFPIISYNSLIWQATY